LAFGLDFGFGLALGLAFGFAFGFGLAFSSICISLACTYFGVAIFLALFSGSQCVTIMTITKVCIATLTKMATEYEKTLPVTTIFIFFQVAQ
ncbi:MAG: hypothetical protein QNK32_00720, partial [Porticoccus sp.]|nr:hypothetical protein [Porticoccus sp.]